MLTKFELVNFLIPVKAMSHLASHLARESLSASRLAASANRVGSSSSSRDDDYLSPEERASAQGITLKPMAEAFTEMNEKLCQGWRMMSETCPISDFPLVQEPGGGKIYSIRTGLEVVRATDPRAAAATEAAARAAVADAAATVAELESKGGSPRRLHGAAASAGGSSLGTSSASSAARSDDVSAGGASSTSTASSAKPAPTRSPTEISDAIGQRLMAGWTLLNETCPTGVCPLMSPPGMGERRWSPALDAFLDETTEAGLQETRGGEASASASAAAVTTETAAAASSIGEESEHARSRREAGQDYADKIGQLLLGGWVMMEQTCPTTGQVPLMKQPGTGRLFSVATNSFVGENNAIEKEKDNGGGEDDNDNDDDDDELESDDDGSSFLAQLRERRLNRMAEAAARPKKSAGGSGNARRGGESVFARARNAVEQKFEDAVALLEASNGSSVRRDAELVALVRECAEALKAL